MRLDLENGVAEPAPTLGEDIPGTYVSLKVAAGALVMIMLISVLGFVDLQLFAVMAPVIKQTFNFTDTQIGFLQGLALSIGGTIAFLPAGILIDRTNRIRFLACLMLLWSVCSMLTGLTQNYTQLFLCRMGLAAAETGLTPAGFSLIADYFAPKHRAQAFLAFYAGTYLSVAGAMSLAGSLIHALEAGTLALPVGLSELPAWRLVFLLSVVPGVALAFLLVALIREPDRRQFGQANEKERSLISFLICDGRAALMLLLSATLAWVSFHGLLFWMPTILARMYGFTAGDSSQTMGMVVAIGSLGGVGLASLMTRIFNRRSVTLAPLNVLRIGILATALLMPCLLLTKSSATLIAGWVAFSIAAWLAHSVMPALLTSATPSALRGRIFSLQIFGVVLVASFAPPSVGYLSDKVMAGIASAPLLSAAVIVGVGFALAALLLTWGIGRRLLAFSRATN